MITNTVEAWHELLKLKDIVALDSILADDAVFYSPVVYSPQEGKELTKLYLIAAFHVFANDSFRYIREVVSDTDAILEFQTEMDGIQVNGVDMISWNEQGLITSFKVMVRPLKAINQVHKMMGEMLKKSDMG